MENSELIEQPEFDELDTDKYKEAVDAVFDEANKDMSRLPRKFPNFGSAHARIAIDGIFSNAKSQILINSELLSKDAYSKELITEFISKGGLIEVVVPDDKIYSSKDSVYSELSEEVRKKLKIFVTQQSNSFKHYMIADDFCIRLENDHPNRKANIHIFYDNLILKAKEAHKELIVTAKSVSNS